MYTGRKYLDVSGVPYIMYRDGNGFWVTSRDVAPVHYEEDFTAEESIDNGIQFISPPGGNWFQLDNVSLNGYGEVTDTYNLMVQEYTDPKSGNPQSYNEVAVFPNAVEELMVPVNEIMGYKTVNMVLGKMWDNYTFLIEKSKFLSVPPNDVSFRYGLTDSDDTEHPYPPTDWVWMQIDNGYASTWRYNEPIDISNITANETHMAYSTTLSAIDGTKTSGLRQVSLVAGSVPPPPQYVYFYGFASKPITDIISVETTSDGRFWILDKTPDDYGKVGSFTFTSNWQYEGSWYSDTVDSHRTFKNPKDLKIYDDDIYIACSNDAGVPEIKVLNNIGVLLKSALCPEVTGIDSMAITTDNVVVLSDGDLYRYDHNLEYIDNIDLRDMISIYNPSEASYSNGEITRLGNNTNGVFFYGIADNLIYKFNQSGSILESFGEKVVNYMNIDGGDNRKPVSDIYHDKDYNLYASSKYDVVRYFDRVEEFDRLLADLSFNIEVDGWTLEDIGVDGDENATSWVYNRVFDRILDNLNMYRLALRGSIALIKTRTFDTVVIDNFKPSDYQPLIYTKHDVSIGINELHCEGALNRCIRQLHECFEQCLGYLNVRGSGIDPTILSMTDFVLESPVGELISGVYYFDYGRSVSNLEMSWADTILFRSDPNLRAYITYPGVGEIVLPTFPVPSTNIDPNTYTFGSGRRGWVIRESFSTFSESLGLYIDWGRRLYIGAMDSSVDGSSITMNQVTDPSNLQGSMLLMDGVVTNFDVDINISYNKRYYIAVPKAYEAIIKMYHPDYGPNPTGDDAGNVTMLYGFNEYTDNATDQWGEDYIIYTNDDFSYTSGTSSIEFKLMKEA